MFAFPRAFQMQRLLGGVLEQVPLDPFQIQFKLGGTFVGGREGPIKPNAVGDPT